MLCGCGRSLRRCVRKYCTSGVTFDLFLPLPLSSLGLGVVTQLVNRVAEVRRVWARVRLLGPWSCRVQIGLLVWPSGGHSGRGTSVGEA